ncbi:hypothetical protein K8R33_03565 [archaeon]|nr:hypothetical protein [archaeon]
MVYFYNIVKSLSLFRKNWKIIVPSLMAFLTSLVFALIFIYMNGLFPVLFRDPSSLFVSGGLAAIAKKISSVLITQSQILKIVLSLAGFVIANFFVGSGLIAMKFSMIDRAAKGKKISLRKSIFGGSKYYWRVIEMRVMVFILILILSLVLSLPLFILSGYISSSSFLVAISVILILLLIRLLLLFRYPILFRENVRAVSALTKAMDLFKSKTKYLMSVWGISIVLLFVAGLFSEFFRIVIMDAFYGAVGLSVILIVFYFIKEIVLVFVNAFIDIFLFVSYLKVRM